MILCVGVGPGVEKRPDGLRMAFTGRLVQRGDAILVPCARIGPAREKRPDGLRMTSTGRPVQRGDAILVPCARIGPAREKRPDGPRMAFTGRPVQRGGTDNRLFYRLCLLLPNGDPLFGGFASGFLFDSVK